MKNDIFDCNKYMKDIEYITNKNKHDDCIERIEKVEEDLKLFNDIIEKLKSNAA